MLHIPASRGAVCLGLAGLVPFIVLSACLWLVAPVWQPDFARALVSWGAIVLGFTGAVHWGVALQDGEEPANLWRYAYGICPSALAWVALNAPAEKGMFILFAGLVAAFIIDRRIYERREWFVYLRGSLTAVACVCLYTGYKALQQ